MLIEVLHFAASGENGGSTTGSPVVDLILPFLNLGVIVVVLIMVLTKHGFIPAWSLDDQKKQYEDQIKTLNEAHAREKEVLQAQVAALQADKNELKDTNDELQNLARDRLLPALIESSRLAAAYVAELQRRGRGGNGGGNRE